MSISSDNMGKPLAMVFVVCGVLIEKDGKYLLVREKQPKVYGLWNLPGGRVDEGETLEEAAVREAKEECGLEVCLIEPLITINRSIELPVLHAYSAKIISGEINFPEDEILDVQWFSKDEILHMKDKLRNQDYILGALGC